MRVSSPSSTAPMRFFFVEVEGEPRDLVRQVQHLHGHAIAQAVDAGDAVADLEDRTDLVDLYFCLIILESASLRTAAISSGRSFTPIRHLSVLR